MPTIYVRTHDAEVKTMLERLAREDNRSATAEVVWLIRQEWMRRRGAEDNMPLETALKTVRRVAEQYGG